MSYPSVVRIYATTQRPDFDNPWQSHSPSSGTGSGVVVAPGKVLTGAHVVANATFVQVQKVSDPNKTVAHVEAVCHDADLALLSVDEPNFMDGIEIAGIGDLPSLRDRISVVGFPVGGEEISITEGVVSRVEVQRYRHSERRLLAVTVDAAINKGNSGGPAFKDGKVAGIAFQTLTNAENIGELVPPPLIHRFLEGIARGLPSFVPGLGVTTQNLENTLLRSRLGLQEEESGVLVVSIEYGGSAWDHLRVGDALLQIAGQRIANNGTIQYRNRFRTSYHVMLGEYFVGDKIKLRVLRDGRRFEVELELRKLEFLVPRRQYDLAPTYFIYGGLVFQPLSLDFLATWKNWWENAPPEFLHHYYSGSQTKEMQEVVILTQVLADEITVGYEGVYNESVMLVNGKRPTSIADFVQHVRAATDVVELRTSRNGVIVLEIEAVRDADERILKRYHISRPYSADLAVL